MEDSAVKGPQREVRVLGSAEAPAENPARVAVHDDGEIAPGPSDFQIGDVADPDLVRPRRQAIELAVGDAREEAVQSRNAPVQLQGAGSEPRLAQEPSNASSAHPPASSGEGAMDARAPVRAAAAGEGGLDLLEQGSILALARARAPLAATRSSPRESRSRARTGASRRTARAACRGTRRSPSSCGREPDGFF